MPSLALPIAIAPRRTSQAKPPMLSQIHDPTLLRFASILVASLLAAPGGVAADTPVPASGNAGMERGTDGNAVTAPKEACDLLMIGDSLIDTLHEFGGEYARLVFWLDLNLGLGADGIRACLQRIRAKTPEAKITLMALLPCRNPASHPERLKVLRINNGLAALAKEAKVDFLDLGAKFLDAEGNLPVALMSDAVHPTLAGYQIWGDSLAPSLP